MRRLKLFFDGGCRPNPGEMEIAVVVGGRAHIVRDLGYGTRLDAEWLALLHALSVVQSLGVQDVVFLGDAADVVRQANGAATARGAAADHLRAFHALAAPSRPLRVRYVKRSQNLAGIALARLHPR